VVKPPANPTIDVTAAVCGQLNVTWSPGAGYPTPTHDKRYDLPQSANGSTWTDVSGYLNTTATAWGPHPNPLANTAYYYRVRAWYVWNGYTSDKTGWVAGSVTYPVCPPTPGAPFLSEPEIINSQIVLNWSVSPTAASYRLERRNLTTASAWTQIYSGGNTGHTDTGATAVGNTYEYRVRACNSVPNCGAYSSTVDIDFYQNVDTRYHYDALGRLVRVVENEATRTGYCYDKAGNRYQVNTGSAGENCPVEPLAAPTGLSAVWQQGPSWHISWNPVYNADNYQLRLDNNSTQTVTATSYYSYGSSGGQPPAPVWVRACYADSGCGPMANF
jgi:YD repeat-containing protein